MWGPGKEAQMLFPRITIMYLVSASKKLLIMVQYKIYPAHIHGKFVPLGELCLYLYRLL